MLVCCDLSFYRVVVLTVLQCLPYCSVCRIAVFTVLQCLPYCSVCRIAVYCSDIHPPSIRTPHCSTCSDNMSLHCGEDSGGGTLVRTKHGTHLHTSKSVPTRSCNSPDTPPWSCTTTGTCWLGRRVIFTSRSEWRSGPGRLARCRNLLAPHG